MTRIVTRISHILDDCLIALEKGDPDEVKRLLKRGKNLLESGDEIEEKERAPGDSPRRDS